LRETNSSIQLIIGLGNPGAAYANTRHNAGADFVELVSNKYSINLKPEARFFGLTGDGMIANQKVRLLIPTTYMNRSGQAAQAICNFYRIPTNQVLVAHDELDLPAGSVRLKVGGGHGGHNGLRDIIQCLGSQNDFIRLRFGIGHPGAAHLVTNYALGKSSPQDQQLMQENFREALDCLPQIVQGEFAQVMQSLHSKKPGSETPTT
jgi:PTH1 family peptidyl-tRNA hydrolase